MNTATIVIICIVAAIVIGLFGSLIIFYFKNRKTPDKPQAEINDKDIQTVVNYIKAQEQEARAKQELKELKTAEQKQKLENFKRTKDELKDRLKTQLTAKEWVPLDNILNKRDKGTVGIYVLYNESKNRYYVGQSKEVYARIKKHFEIEQIARDFCAGDVIKVKMLNATELDTDYRIDHIEKTAIEIFDASANGYNKTTGNM